MSVRTFRTVCVSGYFDPLHVGHVDYFRNARLLGDRLVVILNRDDQKPPGRKLRMTQEDRRLLVESIRHVDETVLSVDDDESVAQTLAMLRPQVFAKGMSATAAEMAACAEHGIEVVTHVGAMIHLQDLLQEFH